MEGGGGGGGFRVDLALRPSARHGMFGSPKARCYTGQQAERPK